MVYPKWLERAANYEIWACSDQGFKNDDYRKVIQMAKDAWALAYLSGTGNGMTPGEFCTKYQDEPKNEIPSVEME